MADATAAYPSATLATFGGEIVGLPESEWTLATQILAGTAAPFSVVVNEAVSARVPTVGWLTLDNEILHYNAVNTGTKTFTCDARAQQDTTAAQHDVGTWVGFAVTKRWYNQIMAEILAHQAENAAGANIASAATTDLSTATGRYVQITGVTTITAFGTMTRGVVRILEFAGALTLTHNATSLILRSGVNATTAAGDIYAFVSEGAGNWRELWHLTAAGGLPAVGSEGQALRVVGGAAAYASDPFSPGIWSYLWNAQMTVPELTVTGTGSAPRTAVANEVQMTTGATSGSTVGLRAQINSAASVKNTGKCRRLELMFGIVQNTNQNFMVFLTDEFVTGSPSLTARHLGIKIVDGVVSFSTGDGTTEQATVITASYNLTGASDQSTVITYDGTTAKCYVDGALVATHATNVPSVVAATAIMRWFLSNSAAVSKVIRVSTFKADFVP